ncbi:Ger(x)C family spore germination protein [Cohnella sp. GCM10027633]|uniref:Ger(x)C family spore germination protein n=1 Tax=unclassified Cohnella TaxID=2636738 RepID=UPI00363A70AE
MTRHALIVVVLVAVISCAGCDKAELTAYGFTQAIAIDLLDDGQVAITTLFYNPSGNGEQGTKPDKKNGIRIRTEAPTLFEAVRDIPLLFGRKAKWDHMRVILIGEEVARRKDVGEMLEFFYRDHEPRTTVPLLLTQGRAGDYLAVKPYIENTIGQQLKRIEEMSVSYSAKTIRTRLLELAIELKSQTGIATLPYLYRLPGTNEVAVSGVALLKGGKLAGGVLSSARTRALIMLLDEFENGVVDAPCGDPRGEGSSDERPGRESFEVLRLHSKLTPVLQGDELTIRTRIEMTLSTNELRCSSIATPEEEKAFRSRIEESVDANVRDIIAELQRRRADAIGIGDRIYRRSPRRWKELKPQWDAIFASARVETSVKVDIISTGMSIGKPFSSR